MVHDLIVRINSPHADKVFVAKDYTKAQLIDELRAYMDKITRVSEATSALLDEIEMSGTVLSAAAVELEKAAGSLHTS